MWVKLLSNVLDSYFKTGESFTYSTILVRAAGEPILGFGGTASGPRILVDGIAKICAVFTSRAGKKLRSVDVLDICNIIGSVVVAGNVRRSAEIALGDADDTLFLRAKNWGTGNIPNTRAFSNNTIYADTYDYINNEFWSGYASGGGEPYGLFNLGLSQREGRLGEDKEDNVEGTNPCAEISLASYEFCNLCELFLNNIESREELIEVARLLYKTQKAITQMPYLHPESEEIVHKNARIGIGVTGICQSLDKLEWLSDAYLAIRAYDKQWSKERGWPESIKISTIKPSGTLSLLAGATPGVHPAYAQYYIRRVRMSSEDALVALCRNAGYAIEYARRYDKTEDYGTVIVSFPCQTPEGALLAENMTAIRQLELVKEMQTIWSDNAVSVTVYYREEELAAIKDWLKENYETGIKSVSFLLHSEHGFDQAPYEAIDYKKYMALKDNIDYTYVSAIGSGLLDDLECATGICPVR